MFVAIYSFHVKDGREKELRKSWVELTKLIINDKGGLGSVLHKAGNNLFIAYAQWPSRDMWDNRKMVMDNKGDQHRESLLDCCTSIQTEYTMEVVEDLLVNK